MRPSREPKRRQRSGEGPDPETETRPTSESSVRLYIGGIDFPRDALPNQIHREHEAGLLRVLAKQASDDTTQRPVSDLDYHALVDHRTGIVLQLAADP